MSTDGIDQAVAAAVDLELSRVPEPVLAHAGRVIADTVAVVRAGARSAQMSALVEMQMAEGQVTQRDGKPASGSTDRRPATVLTTPMARTSTANAAFLNATAGTFLELDEGMRPTGHPAMHLVPAALAVAEDRHTSGSDLLRAVLAGYEVTSRLFRCFRLRYPVHPHGHLGAVGAAVAAAMLDDVDPLLAARIAATTPLLPVWDACYDGATARNTYTGIAAECGVRSCQLARAGFTGSHNVLTAAFGEVAGEVVDAAALSAALSYDDLGITHNYFKRHSACALSHAAIDALLELDLPAAGEIRRVNVETVSNNMKLSRQPRPNTLSGRFSLPYAVATAIVVGRSDAEAFQYRTDVAEFAHRVHVEVAADLEAQWPQSAPARVTVESTSGTQSSTVTNPRGHHTQPFTTEEVQEKFVALLDAPREADTWWQRLTSLRDVADCRSLFEGRVR